MIGFYKRKIEKIITKYLGKFPIVTLLGVRQCGKSTLLRSSFKDYEYVSLEEPDIRKFAMDDPRGFLNNYKSKVVFDEIQRAPELFSYIQSIVDNKNEVGQYIFSGSHNFLLMEKISQSLAGRMAILTLMPLSISELKDANLLSVDCFDLMSKGFYPAIYSRNIEPFEYFPSYIDTYVERDVRLVQNITNSIAFTNFVKLLAMRSGQILNYTELSNICGVSLPTIKSWLSILIQSYIVFELPPYFNNLSKRMVKSKKVYFYDTGLLCYLLGLNDKEKLKKTDKLGSIFETMVVSDYIKEKYFKAKNPNIYFYRDSNQVEVDLIDDENKKAYEIKSSETIDKKYFNNLYKVAKEIGYDVKNLACIYRGDKTFYSDDGSFLRYDSVEND